MYIYNYEAKGCLLAQKVREICCGLLSALYRFGSSYNALRNNREQRRAQSPFWTNDNKRHIKSFAIIFNNIYSITEGSYAQV
jgi:hypothetical protein